MEGDFTVDSMLKEIKSNLNKYESIIKEIESYSSKKKLAEAEAIKKKIEQKIKLVKTITRNEDDNFMLDSYIEFYSENNKRLNIAIKRQEKNKQKNNYKELLNLDKEKHLDNMETIDTLDDEHQSLKNMIKMSTEMTDTIIVTNEELEKQGKTLDESSEKVVKILKKMPIIGKIMGDIKYYQIREKLIIGFVVGIICFILLYITFHRRG